VIGDPNPAAAGASEPYDERDRFDGDHGGTRILSVSSEVRDGDVPKSVADTGAGITPQDTEHIVHPLLTTHPSGRGISVYPVFDTTSAAASRAVLPVKNAGPNRTLVGEAPFRWQTPQKMRSPAYKS
jgi:hypothetical protein